MLWKKSAFTRSRLQKCLCGSDQEEPRIISGLKTPRHRCPVRNCTSRSSNTALSSEQMSLLISVFCTGVHDVVAGVCWEEFHIWVNCRFTSRAKRQRGYHFFFSSGLISQVAGGSNCGTPALSQYVTSSQQHQKTIICSI